MRKLAENEIAEAMRARTGWQRAGDEIRRSLKFAGFMEAIRFVNRVAELAEEADHHPDIDIRYDRVDLALSTHSAGGLTRRDFDLAARIDSLQPADAS